MKASICRSTTGCRPPRIARPVAATNRGRAKSSASARSANVVSTSSAASADPMLCSAGIAGARSATSALVEQLLARERAILRRERAVLERLQLRRDVALRVLERLPAPVVVGNLLRVGVGDLDVEAVHAVVLDLEIGDAGARALARLQRHQEFAAVSSIARSSSSSASKPVAITPPSRTCAAGSAAIARVSSVGPLRVDGERLRERGDERHVRIAPARRRSPAGAPSVSRSPARSRGRAEASAMRAAMRSTSAVRASSLHERATRRAVRRPRRRPRRAAPRRPAASAADA